MTPPSTPPSALTLANGVCRVGLRRARSRLYLCACAYMALALLAPGLVCAGTETTGSPPAAPRMKQGT